MGPRLIGWESRLNAIIDDHRDKPFSWRRNNCGQFAARCVEAITGVDHLARWNGRLSDRPEDIATWALGDPIDPRRAKRGDVVLLRGALGVCLGSHATAPGERGLEFARMTEVDRAWGV